MSSSINHRWNQTNHMYKKLSTRSSWRLVIITSHFYFKKNWKLNTKICLDFRSSTRVLALIQFKTEVPMEWEILNRAAWDGVVRHSKTLVWGYKLGSTSKEYVGELKLCIRARGLDKHSLAKLQAWVEHKNIF